ncbi:MAG: outer membrane protein assembly factor BamE [Porphyrobacter sp.]|nr:outer membrane protein assembly factor BamE [Porphyrobacter sp.]
MAGKWRIGVILGASVLTSGCINSIATHRGYLNDEVLLQSVQPGIDNRQSVERTLGRPSLQSEYGEPVWYYVASTTMQKPFGTPRIAEHSVTAVRFDEAGNVVEVKRTGLDEVAYLNPDSDKTPTLGRERGFLEDLFGNIGQVGMGGAAPGGGAGN